MMMSRAAFGVLMLDARVPARVPAEQLPAVLRLVAGLLEAQLLSVCVRLPAGQLPFVVPLQIADDDAQVAAQGGEERRPTVGLGQVRRADLSPCRLPAVQHG